MNISESATITLGSNPIVGGEFFSQEQQQKPKGALPLLDRGPVEIVVQLQQINQTLINIHTYLTRPKWYALLWKWIKGVFHVA